MELRLIVTLLRLVHKFHRFREHRTPFFHLSYASVGLGEESEKVRAKRVGARSPHGSQALPDLGDTLCALPLESQRPPPYDSGVFQVKSDVVLRGDCHGRLSLHLRSSGLASELVEQRRKAQGRGTTE